LGSCRFLRCGGSLALRGLFLRLALERRLFSVVLALRLGHFDLMLLLFAL
jgi:hypothetical protein